MVPAEPQAENYRVKWGTQAVRPVKQSFDLVKFNRFFPVVRSVLVAEVVAEWDFGR
jgi:hypothetical protein